MAKKITKNNTEPISKLALAIKAEQDRREALNKELSDKFMKENYGGVKPSIASTNDAYKALGIERDDTHTGSYNLSDFNINVDDYKKYGLSGNKASLSNNQHEALFRENEYDTNSKYVKRAGMKTLEGFYDGLRGLFELPKDIDRWLGNSDESQVMGKLFDEEDYATIYNKSGTKDVLADSLYSIGLMGYTLAEQGLLSLATVGSGGATAGIQGLSLINKIKALQRGSIASKTILGMTQGLRNASLNSRDTMDSVREYYNNLRQQQISTTGDSEITDEFIEQKALEAYNTSMNTQAIPSIVFNGIQSAILFGGSLPKNIMQRGTQVGVSSVSDIVETGVSSLFKGVNNKVGKYAIDKLGNALAEGTEEVLEGFSDKYAQSEATGKKASYFDNETLLNFTLGSAMGGILSMGADAIKHFEKKGNAGILEKEYQNKLLETTNTQKKNFNELQKAKANLIQSEITFKEKPNKANKDSLDKARKAYYSSVQQMVEQQTLSTLQQDYIMQKEGYDLYNTHLETLQQTYNAVVSNDTDKLKSFGILDENGKEVMEGSLDLIKEHYKQAIESAPRLKKYFEDAILNISSDEHIATEIATRKNKNDVTEQEISDLNKELDTRYKDNQFYQKLSTEAQKRFRIESELQALNSLEATGNISTNQKERIKELTKELESLGRLDSKDARYYKALLNDVSSIDIVGNYQDVAMAENFIDSNLDRISELNDPKKVQKDILNRINNNIKEAKSKEDLDIVKSYLEANKSQYIDANLYNDINAQIDKKYKEIETIKASESVNPNPVKEETTEVKENSVQPSQNTKDTKAFTIETLKNMGVNMGIDDPNLFDPSQMDFSNRKHSQDNLNRAKQYVDNAVEEIKDYTNKEDITFDDFIKHFIRTGTRKETQDIFNGLVEVWRMSGRDIKDVETVRNNNFNSTNVIKDFINELGLNESDADTVANNNEETLEESVQKEATVVNVENGVPVFENNDIKKTHKTNNPAPKVAHLGVPYIDVKLEDGTYIKRNASKELNVSSEIPNHYSLDPDYMIPGKEFEVKVPNNFEDILVADWSFDENNVPVKTAIPFREYVNKYNLKPGTQAYNNKVPLIAYDGDTPIFMLHDTDWYNESNVEGEDTIRLGVEAIARNREAILSGNNKIVIRENKTGSFFNVSRMADPKDRNLISLSEATKETKLTTASNTTELRDKEAKPVNTRDNGFPIINDLESTPLEKGQIYELRRMSNGKYIALKVQTNNVSKGEDINDTAYNSVKYGILSSIVLANSNNPTLLTKLEKDYGITLSKAESIDNAFKDSMGVSVTNLYDFISLFTMVNRDYSYFDSLMNSREVKSNGELKFPIGNTYLFVTKTSKGQTQIKFVNKEDKAYVPKTGNHYVDYPGFTIESINEDTSFNEFNRFFGGENGLFRKSPFSPNGKFMGKETTFPQITSNGDLKPYSDNRNGENTYDGYVKDNVKTNVLSFEIDTIDGHKKTITDIQPMIYWDVTSEVKPLKERVEEIKEQLSVTPLGQKISEERIQASIDEESDKAFLEQQRSDKRVRAEANLIRLEKAYKEGKIGEKEYRIGKESLERSLKGTYDFSRKGLSEAEYLLIQQIESNRIDGISIVEQKDLVSSLFYGVLSNIDLKANKVSLGQIAKLLQESVDKEIVPLLEDVNNTIKLYEELGLDTETLSNDAKKYEAILNQKDKLTSQTGQLTQMMERFFAEEIELHELETNDNVEANDNGEVENNYSQSSFERNMKTSFSNKLKLFFANIKDRDANGEEIKNSIGLTKYVDIDTSIMLLKEVTTKVDSKIEDVLGALKAKSLDTKKPYHQIYSQIYNTLVNADDQIKNELLYKMITNKLDMYMILYSQDRKNNQFLLGLQNANSLDSSISMKLKWKNNFKNSSLIVLGKDDNRIYDKKKIKSVISKIDTLSKKKSFTQEDIAQIKDILKSVGIDISDNTLEDLVRVKGTNLFHNYGILSNIRKVFNDISSSPENVLFEDKKFNFFDKQPTDINFLINMEIDLNGTSVAKSFRVGGKSIQGSVQQMMIYDVFKNIKDVDSELSQTLRESAFSKRNYVLDLLLEDELVKEQLSVDFVSLEAIKERGKQVFDSRKITDLSETDNILSQLGFFQNTVKEIKTKVKGYDNLSFRVAKVLNATLSDKDQMLAYNVPVLNLRKENIKTTNGKISLNDDVISFTTNQIFSSEFDRIIDSYRTKFNIKGYDDASKVFISIPAFNTISISLDGNTISVLDFIKMNYNNQEVIDKIRPMFEAEAKKIIRDTIDNEVRNKVDLENNTGEWFDNNFLSLNENGVLELNHLDSKYLGEKASRPENQAIMSAYDFVINQLLSQNNMYQLYAGDVALYAPSPKKFINDKKQDYVGFSEKVGENITKRLAMLIAPGNKLANSKGDKYLQIFLNDNVTITSTAEQLIKQYNNGVLSEDNRKALEALKQAEKELQELYDTRSTYPDFDEKISAKMDEISKYRGTLSDLNPEIGAYFDIEGADAQEYTTWQEHMDIIWRQGRLTKEDKETFTKAYEKLSKGEILDASELKLVFQPIKPVYAGNKIMRDENTGITMNRIVYVKSSSFPLLPQLTAGLEIDMVRQHMEKLQDTVRDPNTGKPRQVRLSYQTANKVGAVNTKLTVQDLYNLSFDELYSIDENGKVSGKLFDATLELDRDNFKIQQDTPYKTDKYKEKHSDDYITMGSQFWKIILGSGINKETKNIFPDIFDENLLKSLGINSVDNNLSGTDLDKIKTYVESEYSKLKLHQLYDELGIDKKTGKPKKLSATIKAVQKLLKREVATRNYAENVMDGLEILETDVDSLEFNIPLWLSTGSNKFESLLQAIISNRLITLKLPGNSHISASAEGFKKPEVKSLEDLKDENLKSQIVWVDGNHSGELKATTNENGVLKEAEVLIQSKFRITKTDENGNKYTELTDLTKPPYSTRDEKTGRLVLNQDAIDPDLLSIFSFRIPTSSHQSGAILKVVGFLPEASGDSLVVPKEHTKQIGEDFDIDKRNLYKAHYTVDENGYIRKLKEEHFEKEFPYKSKIESLKEELTELLQNSSELYSKAKSLEPDENIDIDDTDVNSFLKDLFNVKDDPKELKDLYKELKLNKKLKEILKAEIKDNKLKNRIYRKQQEKFRTKLLENAMIDVYKSVYLTTNDDIQRKINRVLSMDVAENTAKVIDSRLNSNVDKTYFTIFSDSYQRKMMRLGATGKLGIGVHSNAVTFQAQMERLHNPLVLKEKLYDDKGKFIGWKNKEIIIGSYTDKEGNQKSYMSDGTLGKIRTIDNIRTISDIHAENQNSATDNVKAQIMGKRNENAYTINVLTQLAYRGFDLVPSRVGNLQLGSLFISQPIIRRYVELKEKQKSITATFNNNAEQDILETLIKEFNISEHNILRDATGKINKTDFLEKGLYDSTSYNMTGDTLYDNLLPETASSDIQLAVLQKFFILEEEAKKLNEYQKLINMSTSKLGISYFNVLDRIETLEKLATDDSIGNVKDLVGEFYIKSEKDTSATIEAKEKEGFIKIGNVWVKPTTTEGIQLVNSLSIGDTLMSQFYPYKNNDVKYIIDKISAISGKELSPTGLTQLRYEIMSNLRDFLYSSENSGLFSGSINSNRESLFFDRNGNESLASFVNRMQGNKHPLFIKNEFLKDLTTNVNKDGSPSTISSTFTEDTNFSKTSKYQDFLHLLQDNETIIGELNGETITPFKLAQDLASYAFLANAEGGALGFRDYINQDFLNAIGMSKVLREGLKDIDPDIFIRQFIQHNPNRATIFNEKNFKADKILALDELTQHLLDKAPKFKKVDSKNIEIPLLDNVLGSLKYFRYDFGADIERPKFIAFRDTSKKLSDNKYKLYEYDANTDTYYQIPVLGTLGYNEYNPNTYFQDSLIYPVENHFETETILFEDNILPEDLDAEMSLENVLNEVFDSESKFFNTLQELLPYVTKDLKVVYSKDSRVTSGAYNLTENQIELIPNFFSAFDKATQQEIILEELIHSITSNEIEKYGVYDSEEGTFIPYENAPVFVLKLVSLYDIARKALPYNSQAGIGNDNYPSKNIKEFIAGVFYDDAYRQKLDSIKQGNKSLLDLFREAVASLVRYVTGSKYSDEVVSSVKDLIKATRVENKDNILSHKNYRTYNNKLLNLIDKLELSNEIYDDNISEISPKELASRGIGVAEREFYAPKLVDELMKGKEILISDKNFRTKEEAPLVQALINTILEVIPKGDKPIDYIEVKNYPNNVQGVKINTNFAKLKWSALNKSSLRNTLDDILSNSTNADNLYEVLKESNIIQEKC